MNVLVKDGKGMYKTVSLDEANRLNKVRSWAQRTIRQNKGRAGLKFMMTGNTVICISLSEAKEAKVGVAHCNADDIFDAVVGRAIALSRATGITIPAFIYGKS